MRDSLKKLCGEFLENRDAVKKAFSLESAYLYPVCGAVFLEKEKKADPMRLRECNEILKEQTGFFSNFRGNARLPILSMMAAGANPEGRLAKAVELYEILKLHFHGSQYLPLTAMVLIDLVKEVSYDGIAEQTKAVYRKMKEEHPFLTSGEDTVFAALLAISGKDPETVGKEMETCFRLLKPEFFDSNAVQALAQVLTLFDGDPAVKCTRTMDLFEGLKKKGCRYGTGYELATLGVLAMIPSDPELVMADIAEVDAYLSEQKGYGALGPGKRQRLMHAGMIVACDSMRDSVMSTAAIGSVIAMVVAEQAALCAAIAATTAAQAAAT